MTAGLAFRLGEAPDVADRRTIPLDYAFRFDLSGVANRSHVRKITVSVEAAFTAVSVGYGVVPSAQPCVSAPTPSEVWASPSQALVSPTCRPRWLMSSLDSCSPP